MGFFDWLFGESDSTSSQEVKQPELVPEVEIGKIMTGVITRIEPDYTFAVANGTDIFIHITEVIKGNSRQEDLNDYLTDGQEIEIVPISKDDRGWKGSIQIAELFRKREQLKGLRKRIFKGDELRIKEFNRSGLILEYEILEYENGIEIRIPENELPVALQKKNTVRKVRNLIKDGSLKIKKTGMFPPKDQIYAYNLKGKNEAYLTGTFEYIPSKETVDIVTHAYPFKLEVRAIRRYELDTVSVFVLKALGEGKSVQSIAQITGLKEKTIEEIREKLVHRNYMKGWELTHKAERFLEAVQREEVINKNNFGGYFASTAHPMHEIITNDTPFERVDYANSDKLFSKDPKAWEDFSNKTDEDLSYPFLKNIVPEDQTDTLTEAEMSDLLRISIRKARKPDALFLVPTPVDWFYGGLLSNFTPLTEIPEKVEIPETYCSSYLLIKYDVTHTPALAESGPENERSADEFKEAEVIKSVFYETNTKTIWQLKNDRIKVVDIKKPVSSSPIDGNFILDLPNGDKIDTFRNPQVKLIPNL